MIGKCECTSNGAYRKPRFLSFPLSSPLQQPIPRLLKAEEASESYRSDSLSLQDTYFIIQLRIPCRLSEIHVRIGKTEADETWHLTTTNIRRFKFQRVTDLSHPTNVIHIDGNRFALTATDGSEGGIDIFDAKTTFCNLDGQWQLCKDGDSYEQRERGPHTYGPARQVAEAPFLIVIGEKGDSASRLQLDLALYLVNQHYIAYSTFAPIVMASELSEDTVIDGGYNLILIGNIHQNSWTKKVLDTRKGEVSFFPVDAEQLETGHARFSLGPSNFTNPSTAVLFTHPIFLNPRQSRASLALILAATDDTGMRNLFSLAAPTIPPMVRAPFANLIPDFIVAGTY